jgi:hypothetical protein
MLNKQPDYSLFSKRHQRTKYNKGIRSINKCNLEKWFEDRKCVSNVSVTQVINYNLEDNSIKTQYDKHINLPPGLGICINNDCQLDIIIPSYDDFNYIYHDE